jgi:hypothetical protein
MMKLLVLTFFTISLSLSAKINMSAFKTEVTLGTQKVSIAKAEIINNKMPGIGVDKNRKYIVITLKADDKKKIKEKYTIERISFPSCTRKFSAEVKELRGDGCVVRSLPAWAGKGVLVVLTIKDAQGNVHMLKVTASEMEVQ